jgi:hypothetical protein
MEKAARRGVMNSAHIVCLPQTPFHSSPTTFSITLLLLSLRRGRRPALSAIEKHRQHGRGESGTRGFFQ